MNWKKLLTRTLLSVFALVLVLVAVLVYQIVSFKGSAEKQYEIAPLAVVASLDSAVVARGEHLATALGGCRGCHGPDLSGQLVDDMGPIGRFLAPNLTSGRGGIGETYTDGELARAIRHGIRQDGTTLMFMPSGEHAWWPDSDLQAIVSYVRSVPPVDNEVEASVVGPVGKILTGLGVFDLRSAEGAKLALELGPAPSPAPTAEYGAFLAFGCQGCHGESLAGGPIPGAPSSLPIPANLTMHETGIGAWDIEDFIATLNTGVRPNGEQLDPFMPIEGTRAMTTLEKTALWEYIQSIEPQEFGTR